MYIPGDRLPFLPGKHHFRVSQAAAGIGTFLAKTDREVCMLGRRSHSRFAINPSPDGLLRIVNDVVVQQSEADGLVAISREAAIVGESLEVQVMTRQGVMHTSVRVTESRPLVTDGTVRHRLQLEPDPPTRIAF